MDTEWISIVDTAVKIGLGALLTGVFSYFGIKSSQKSERAKFLLEHKVKTLEKVSEEIELYFYSWKMLTTAVAGVALKRKRAGRESEPLTDENQEFLKEWTDHLVDSWKYRESAISKLRLLGEEKVADELIVCRAVEKQLRNSIVFEGKMLTHDETEAYKEELKSQLLKVQNGLAKFYKALG